MRTRTLVLFFSVLFGLVRVSEGQITDHPAVASNLGLVEAWIEAQMAYRGLPGLTVGVVYDQELVYAKGFGYADVEAATPATPSTIYRIASHSKLFTAIAILQLRDAGQLSLDEPIATYLPWFQIQNSYEHAPPVTLRQILTHTSGLPREAGSGYWIDFDFPTLDEVRGRLQEQAMVFPPETRWKYSNLALTLAGEVVAEVSGQSFAEHVQEHIFDKLGMTGSSVVFPDEHEGRLAVGYGRRLPDGSRERFPFVDAVSMAAATGVSSSVEDMARFISWQFRLRDGGGTEVLRASTLREMQRVQWLEPDWDRAWGLGFEIFHTEGRDLIGHGGGYPGYRTATHISPEERWG
jgi:CubicO group peptidase (beta-lactamase class C family)